jgi:hypothetical protein
MGLSECSSEKRERVPDAIAEANKGPETEGRSVSVQRERHETNTMSERTEALASQAEILHPVRP